MAEKRSKSSVDYGQGGDHCGVCTHFIAENEATETGKCELVAGDIGEDMWCKLFARKRGKGYKKTGMARHVRKKS